MELLMLLSILILLSCFVLVACKSVKSYIRTFRFQSFLIAFSAALLGFLNFGHEDSLDIFIVSLVLIALKVFYIPRLLLKTFDNVKYTTEKDYFFKIPSLELICCLIVIFCYFTLPSINILGEYQLKTYIINSMSVILIGILFMVTRKKAIGQIVGFLVVENGLFITAMYSTHGMPMIVDMGIFIDLITFVLIMGMLTFRIDKNFDSIDINKLKNLRG